MFRAFLTYLAAVAILVVILGLLAFALYTGYGRYVPQTFTAHIAAPAAAAGSEPPTSAPATPPPAAPPAATSPAAPAALLEVPPAAVLPAATATATTTPASQPAAAVAPIFTPTDGTPPDATLQLIDMRMKAGELMQALALCRQTLEKDPKNLDVRIRYAAILSVSGNDNDAYREASAVLADRPDDYRAHLLLAGMMLRRGLPSAAVMHARKAIAAAPTAPECASLLGQVLLADGAVAEAKTVLEKLVMTRPDDAEVLMSLGSSYARTGETNRAIEVFQKVQELQPESPSPDLALGELSILSGHRQEAIENYRQVLAKAPVHPVGLNNLATLLFEEKGDTAEAMRLASQAWQLYPDSPQIADTLGWLYAQTKDYAKATVLLGFAVRREPREPTMRYHLAVVLHARGLVEEADRQLTAALESGAPFQDAAAARKLQDDIRGVEAAPVPQP